MNRTLFAGPALAPWWLLAILAIGTAFLTASWPSPSSLAVALLFFLALSLFFRTQLPRLFLTALCICLLGYAALGRAFAYVHVGPAYVGEALLVLGILAALEARRLHLVARSPVIVALLLFMCLSSIATVPHIPTYGLYALRDAALWGYGLFAIVVASVLLRTQALSSLLRTYGRFLPYMIAWFPIGIGLSNTDILSSIGLNLSLKPADAAVHLAAAAAYLLLLDRDPQWGRPARPRAATWLFWLVATALTLASRTSLLVVAAVLMLVSLMRPLNVRLYHLLFITLTFIVVVLVVDPRLEIRGRTVSVTDVYQRIEGIFDQSEDPGAEGSKQFRLNWWTDIIRYTFTGDHFWTGKGYGINLADDDGYQVTRDGSLRNPHNGHLTVLARSGVPGFVAWIYLQFAYLASMIRAYQRSRMQQGQFTSATYLWLICCWLALAIKASFDVYLEGPQGGIWYWTIIGVGVAATIGQDRRGSRSERASASTTASQLL